MKRLLAALPVLILAGSFAGCASKPSPRDPATDTAASLEETSSSLQDLKAQVGETLAAMERIPGSGGNLASTFGDYRGQLDELKKSLNQVSEQQRSLDGQLTRYQQQWAADTARFDSGNLRENAQRRLNEVRDTIDDIDPAYDRVRDSGRDLVSHLEEIRTYLGNDLTTPAVRSITPTLEEARQRGATLRTNIDELLIEMREINDTITPPGTVQNT